VKSTLDSTGRRDIYRRKSLYIPTCLYGVHGKAFTFLPLPSFVIRIDVAATLRQNCGGIIYSSFR
jgi:hypothetical protein